MSYIANLKLVQWRKLFSIFKPSILQSLNFFGTRKGSEFEFKFGKFFFLKIEKNSKLESGPQVGLPSSLFTIAADHRPTHAHQAAGYHTVSALTAVRTPAPDATDHRHPTWVSMPYPLRVCAQQKSSTISPPPHARSHSPLSLPPCFLLPTPLLTVAGHHRLLPLLSKSAETSASMSSMVDADREPEPTATSSMRAIVFPAVFLHAPHHH
jgi:hypothetical protein